MAEVASRCAGRGLGVTNESQQWGREQWPHSLRLFKEAATQHMHIVEVKVLWEKGIKDTAIVLT